MDTVYGTKKYFQSLGASDSDYYNRSSTNRAVAACSSYQNTLGTLGRHSTIGPYSHISSKYPYPSPDLSHGSQYGYNSWGMWRDSRNLTPSSTYSSKSRSSMKSFTIILMTAAFIVVLAVLSVAALAFYFSTFKSDDSIMVFDGKFQVTRGDVFTTGLKYNHTSAFQQKAEFYNNLVVESLERNGLSVYKCIVNGFGNGPLINVDFRVYLDMRRVPMTIRSVEEHIKDSILKEVMSIKSSKSLHIDLSTLEIKRLLDTDILRSASFVREREQVPTTMNPFDDKYIKSTPIVSNKGSLSSRSSSTSNNKAKPSNIEPEIDMEKVPIVQGSFEVTKTDADITHKKQNIVPKTSTLRPFTITNGSVRMKPKKTTIEKVKPLPKIPENLTANILKLENVTIPYNFERTTTARYFPAEEPTTTTPSSMILISMAPTKSLMHPMSSTPRPPLPTSSTTTTAAPSTSTTESTTTSTTEMNEYSAPSEVTTPQPMAHPTISIVQQTLPVTTTAQTPVTSGNTVITTGDITPTDSTLPKLDQNLFTTAPRLDDQPWHPINPAEMQVPSAIPPATPPVIPPVVMPVNISKKVDTIEITSQPPQPMPMPKMPPNNADLVGIKLLPRNKIRPPVAPMHKTKRPVYYQGYSHPAFMYSTHEVERLGTGPVKPYPLPVDKISEQPMPPKLLPVEEIVLNRGEMLPNGFEFTKQQPDGTVTTIAVLSTTTTEQPTTASTSTSTASVPTLAEAEEKELASSSTTTQKSVDESDAEPSTELYSVASGSTEDSEMTSTESNTQYIGDILLDLLSGDDSNLTNSDTVDDSPLLSRMDDIDLPMEDGNIGVDSQSSNSASQEILNFKNIKEYIMATTKLPDKAFFTSEANSNERRAQTSTATIEAIDDITDDHITVQPTNAADDEVDDDIQRSTETDSDESQTSGYVEVETVQYTPVSSAWDQPSLFPVQTKWEFINGTLVQTDRAPMKKVFNQTLQAWIVENPQESGERIEPERYIRHNSEEIKNISTIFDTLSSKLGIGPSIPSKTPPFTSFSQNKLRDKVGSGNSANFDSDSRIIGYNNLNSNSPARMPATTPTTMTTTPTSSDITSNPNSPLPILLNPQTENYFSSSAENVFGQAEIEEIDPTQYEQMLLLDKVSSFSHRTSTMPSLVTLLPVKSNTGIRNALPSILNEKNALLASNGRGFVQNTQAQQLADTAVVVRTNINVSA